MADSISNPFRRSRFIVGSAVVAVLTGLTFSGCSSAESEIAKDQVDSDRALALHRSMAAVVIEDITRRSADWKPSEHVLSTGYWQMSEKSYADSNNTQHGVRLLSKGVETPTIETVKKIEVYQKPDASRWPNAKGYSIAIGNDGYMLSDGLWYGTLHCGKDQKNVSFGVDSDEFVDDDLYGEIMAQALRIEQDILRDKAPAPELAAGCIEANTGEF